MAALNWARNHRTLVASFVHATISWVALYIAFLAEFGFSPQTVELSDFLWSAAVLIAIRIPVNFGLRLHVSRWRFVGSRDFFRLAVTHTLGSLFFFALAGFSLIPVVIPGSIIVLEWALGGYVTMTAWVAYRILFERSQTLQNPDRRRVVVIGAGEAGGALVGQMLRLPWGYNPVAYLDDDPLKLGTSLHGLDVVGDTSCVRSVIDEFEIDELVLSLPSASAVDLRRIVEQCEETKLPIKILPGIDEVLDGSVSPGQLREIRIEDLLGREPVTLELPRLAEELVEATVLVTGAAGSIGSELCRQIALNSPKRLVLVDQAESPLYFLDLELRDNYPTLEIVTVVGDVTNPDTLASVFSRYSPQRVFHAAAYKHVPLMEANPLEAIRTNVLGTYRVASASAKAGCERFVLVSTDKAVRPVNVMGASKAAAERVVLWFHERFPTCAFGAVRFGNVLGSNGSVVPLFRRQLQRGEPLTVTHEDVTRYFMTIAEAVQLILKASLLSELKGSVAMLDMGEPVRIIDLAKDMLRLTGLPYKPGENVVITGLRPGEKLHEELSAPDEQSVPTELKRISILRSEESELRMSSPLIKAIETGDVMQTMDLVLANMSASSEERVGAETSELQRL